MLVDLISLGAKILDKVLPDQATKDQAKLRLIELEHAGELANLQADVVEQQELTKRSVADVQSDSWLAKNVRPIALLYLLFAPMVMNFMVAAGYDVRESMYGLLEMWGIVALSFYFGGRSYEKIRRIGQGEKDA